MRFTLAWYGKRQRLLTDRRNRLYSFGQTLRILLAPFQRLPDDFVFVRAREIPQPPLARSLVDKRGKGRSLRAPPGVQLDRNSLPFNALSLKSCSSRSNIITRMQSPRHPQPVNTAFQYKGHRVEIMGDPSAPTITVDGKDYTPFYKGSDLSPEMWIIGRINAQEPLKTRGSS
jgi:hypothetical protein